MSTEQQRFVPEDPGDYKLYRLRRDYLERCEPEMLSRMEDSELEEHLSLRANLCRRNAGRRVASGTPPPQAWQWAIREVLCEAEED